MNFRLNERSILSNKTWEDGQSPEVLRQEPIKSWHGKSTASDPWEWQSLSLVLCRCSFSPWCVCSLRLLPYRKPPTEISQTCSLLCLYTRNLPLPVRCLRQTPSFWASPGAPPPECKVHPNLTFLYVCLSFLHSSAPLSGQVQSCVGQWRDWFGKTLNSNLWPPYAHAFMYIHAHTHEQITTYIQVCTCMHAQNNLTGKCVRNM